MRYVTVEIEATDDYLEVEQAWVENEGHIVVQIKDSDTQTSSTLHLMCRYDNGKADVPAPVVVSLPPRPVEI